MEKERGSNDVNDEKLEAQDREYLDSVQTNAIDPIPDPDAGLSAEERAEIVCSHRVMCFAMSLGLTSTSGPQTRTETRLEPDTMAFVLVPHLLPGSYEHR